LLHHAFFDHINLATGEPVTIVPQPDRLLQKFDSAMKMAASFQDLQGESFWMTSFTKASRRI
jgi:hypothetical protein